MSQRCQKQTIDAVLDSRSIGRTIGGMSSSGPTSQTLLRSGGAELRLQPVNDVLEMLLRISPRNNDAIDCHSACNIDPLSRGIGVQN